MPPTTLGRYRLLQRIAVGGMGEVYRGVDVGWGGIERPVAVKLIAPGMKNHQAVVRTFIDEAKLSFLLAHANVVQVRDIGEADGKYFIAMEWVEGCDLGTLLETLRKSGAKPPPLRLALLILIEACRGLDYAHRLKDANGRPLNLVHRDVSPANLLLSYEGEVKVGDFGIARSRLQQLASMPGGLKGKIPYMPPEQARGEVVDARADIYALGVVLYELLALHNPFSSGAGEAEALRRVIENDYKPLRAMSPSVADGLEQIVQRAMARSREARYGSCAELRADLESYAARTGLHFSSADLGAFVRQTVPPQRRAESERPMTLPPLPDAPRGAGGGLFDQALGASLAGLVEAAPRTAAQPRISNEFEPEATAAAKRRPVLSPPPPVALLPTLPATNPPQYATTQAPVIDNGDTVPLPFAPPSMSGLLPMGEGTNTRPMNEVPAADLVDSAPTKVASPSGRGGERVAMADTEPQRVTAVGTKPKSGNRPISAPGGGRGVASPGTSGTSSSDRAGEVPMGSGDRRKAVVGEHALVPAAPVHEPEPSEAIGTGGRMSSGQVAVLLFIVAIGLAFSIVYVYKSRIAVPRQDAPAARVEKALPPVVETPPAPAVAPVIEERPSQPPEVVAAEAAPPKPARLTIESDIEANVYVDGKFVGVTPASGVLVLPGKKHEVRVEDPSTGIRLTERKETVMLEPGEARTLKVPLK